MAKHGREHILQEGEDVLVGLKQTPHGLQLHHLWIRPLRDWEVKQESAASAASTREAVRSRERLRRTVADFFHYERVEADLVNALVQAVGVIDLPQFFVEHHLLGVRQLRAQDPIVELL